MAFGSVGTLKICILPISEHRMSFSFFPSPSISFFQCFTVSRVQAFHTLDPVLKKLSVLYFASTSPNLWNLQERPSLSFHNQMWQADNALKWLKMNCIHVTTMTSHLTSVRMAQCQHTGINKGCSGCGGKTTLVHRSWDINWYHHSESHYGGASTN